MKKEYQENKIYNCLLVGFGKIAADYSRDKKMAKYIKYASHIQVLTKHPKFNILSVIDPSEEALYKAKINWGIQETYKNIDDLKNPEKYDVAILAIPPLNRFNTIKKLTNLKGLIIEKPLAEDLEEAYKIIQLCNQKNIVVQVNYTRRFDREMLKIKQNMEKNFGNIQAAFGVYGNGLNNNGSHLIDWAIMFLGEVSWVKSISKKEFFNKSSNADKNISFILGFKSGVELMAQPINFKNYRENYLDIWGTKGRISFIQEGLYCSISNLQEHRFAENEFEIKNDKQSIKIMDQSFSLYNLYEDLLQSLSSSKKTSSDITNALTVLKIVKSIENSFLKHNIKVDIK